MWEPFPWCLGKLQKTSPPTLPRVNRFPTACALGVLVDKDLSVAAAGGYLIQLLPGATDEMIDKIEAGIAKVGPVTEHLRQGVTPEELLQMVLSEFDLELLKTVPVEYRCYCSRDRMRRALISLGKRGSWRRSSTNRDGLK